MRILQRFLKVRPISQTNCLGWQLCRSHMTTVWPPGLKSTRVATCVAAAARGFTPPGGRRPLQTHHWIPSWCRSRYFSEISQNLWLNKMTCWECRGWILSNTIQDVFGLANAWLWERIGENISHLCNIWWYLEHNRMDNIDWNILS